MTTTDAERRQRLASLGLNPDAGASLAKAVPPPPVPVIEHQATTRQPVIAPTGVDPKAMPVDEIVFDPALLDNFPSLEPKHASAACQHVFGIYKSHTKGDRNKALWPRVQRFVREVRESRVHPHVTVKDKVKATKAERDMARYLSNSGIPLDRLAEAVAILQQQDASTTEA